MANKFIMKTLKKAAKLYKRVIALAVAPGFGHTTYWPV